MDFLVAVFVILFSLLVGLIPFSLLYGPADLLYVLFFRVIKYRRNIVEKNLRDTFPNLTGAEIKSLMKRFYRNLGDVMIEGIKAFTMPSHQIIKRHKCMNPEVVMPYFRAGKSIIACPGHCANWEWGSMPGGLQLPFDIIVLYKPLANRWLDKYLRWTRARFGSRLVSIYKTGSIFRQYSPKNSAFVMAADQSPSNLNKAVWVDFMGRRTAFLHGPESYARKHDLPVFYVDIRRVKRGYYELRFDLITDEPTRVEQGVITQRYAYRLAQTIERDRGSWLWSHRRWKHGG